MDVLCHEMGNAHASKDMSEEGKVMFSASILVMLSLKLLYRPNVWNSENKLGEATPGFEI